MSKKRRNNPYEALKGLTSPPRRWCPSSIPPTTCPSPPPCSPRQKIPNQLENCWRTSQTTRLCCRDRSCGGRTGPVQGPPSWYSTTHGCAHCWPWPCCQLNCNELYVLYSKSDHTCLKPTSGKRGVGMITRVHVVARRCPRVRLAEVASCPRRRGLTDEGAHRHRLTSLVNFAHL